jgi:hypothetical protein
MQHGACSCRRALGAADDGFERQPCRAPPPRASDRSRGALLCQVYAIKSSAPWTCLAGRLFAASALKQLGPMSREISLAMAERWRCAQAMALTGWQAEPNRTALPTPTDPPWQHLAKT